MPTLLFCSRTVTFVAMPNAPQSSQIDPRIEPNDRRQAAMPSELATFIAAQRSAFLATATADAEPEFQHRVGPPGFLRVIDPRTLGFAAVAADRHCMTEDNPAARPKAQLFLIDFAQQRRVTIWGQVRLVESDTTLLLTVHGWEGSRPQNTPRFRDADDTARARAAYLVAASA